MFGDVVRELAPSYVDAPDADGNVTSVWPAAGSAWPHEAAVWASGGTADCSVDLGALSGGELKALVVELAAERSRIEGRYLAAVGELASRNGAQSAAYILRDQTRMNCAQARSEARLAESLVSEGLTGTLEAMQAGEIHMSHARVIAREAPKKHRRSEDDFLELARVYPSDTIARHPLAYRSQQVEADLAAEAAAESLSPIDAELALQRQERSASLRMGDDGMWHLHGKFDFLAGRELSTALEAQLRSLRRRAELDAGSADGSQSGSSDDGRHDSNTGSDSPTPTRRQLLADALSELVAGTASARHAKNNLIIIADYDVTSDRLANPRLDDGTPLSAQMLVEHAVDAKVLPAMFSADWSELALGRTRNANDAQRLVLAVRDGGCIGCKLTSEHTQAHHIDYFENGGLTEVPNLASMCGPCHRDLHTRGRKIHTPPDGRPRLQPPEPRNASPPSRDPTHAAATARSP
ncbi:HNH endonuclease [Candidatus Poriferisodalis sp.]|uniref:HNH endonuclease signature motif containing protein n=1 Tax=Candidatus Poriferisodalis sp. TaxID=3101277 RepID=UPI003B022A55